MGSGPANKSYQEGRTARTIDEALGTKTPNPYSHFGKYRYPWQRGYDEWQPDPTPDEESECVA